MMHRCERRFDQIRGPHVLPVFGPEVVECEQCLVVFRELLDGLWVLSRVRVDEPVERGDWTLFGRASIR